MNDPAIFDDFLATGTIRSKQVDLYADQEAGAELDALAVEASRDDLTDAEAEELLARVQELRARWEASRARFTVERLPETVREQIASEYPMPKPPRPLGMGATEKRRAEWQAEMDRFEKARDAWQVEHTAAVLAYALSRVEMPGGVMERRLNADGQVEVPALTVEQVRTLARMPYGPQWIARLHAAIEEVSELANGSVDIPFSRDVSGTALA